MRARQAKKIMDSYSPVSPNDTPVSGTVLCHHSTWVTAHRVWTRRCRRAVAGGWFCGSPTRRSGKLWQIVALSTAAMAKDPRVFRDAVRNSPLLSKYIVVREPEATT